MEDQNLQSKIDAANEKMIAIGDDGPFTADYYQQGISERRKFSKKQFPNGSSRFTSVIASELLSSLAPAFKKAKDDSDISKKRGDKERARIVKQQYMEEKYLPVVDAVVRSTNVDEVLNNQSVLNDLDEYVLIDGGSGSGYTRAYIQSAYGDLRGKFVGSSDASVQHGVNRINTLIDNDQIRAAVGVANQLKDKIDNGDAIASDEDYDLISRVVSRGM